MNINEYHSDISHASKSKLDKVAVSPYTYWRHYLAPEEARPIPKHERHFTLGSAVHKLVLERSTFSEDFAFMPKMDMRRTASKAEFSRIQAENPGKTIINEEDFRTAKKIAAAIRDHDLAGDLVAMITHAEHTIRWVDASTGMKCKARPDGLIAPDLSDMSPGVCLDIKTTQDASPAGFRKHVEDFRYYVQDAFYMDGLNAQERPAGWPSWQPLYTEFYFIVVEESDYITAKNVAVYQLDQEDRDLGRMEYIRDLQTLEGCLASDDWPHHPGGVTRLPMAEWKRRKIRQKLGIE